MVSITLSVPDVVRKHMKKYDEVNWSGFVRKCIESKVQELSLRDQLLAQSKQEQETINWSVDLQQKSRKGRAKLLRKKGLMS